MMRWWMQAALAASMGAMLLLGGCDDDGGDPDAGPSMDSGPATDSGPGEDAGPDEDAGCACTELAPECCPRMFPMTPIPAESVCDQFAFIFCNANANCCENPEWTYPTTDTCESEQQARCEDMMFRLEFADLLPTGNIQYSQAGAGFEYAEAGTLADQCVEVDFTQTILDLYTGTLEFNEDCTASPECMSGLNCEDQTGMLTCRPPLGVGSMCTENADCIAGNRRCDMGTCQPRFPSMAGCAEDSDCETDYCEDGLCVELTGANMYCVRNIGDIGYPAFIP